MRGAIAISTALLLAACYHGPSIYRFEPVQGPAGVQADLRMENARVRGELLEVQDSALIVLTDSDKVVSVPVRDIRTGTFNKLGDAIYENVPPQSTLAKIRSFSRFPSGLTPALRARLLAAYGQSEETPVDSALESFIGRARAGTEALRSPAAAQLAGYHPVGPDFPGMGRHWIHTSLILRPTPDPAQPPVLEYAEINGTATLVGVAYAVLVHMDTAPATLPVPATAWHFHQGTVDEESFLRSHAGVGGGGGHTMPGPSGPRLAVVHAWIWLENPDGLLATDNWALPYARLGIPVPSGSGTHAAARALALAAGDGGRMYLEALIHAVGQPSASETAAVATVLRDHQAKARSRASQTAALEECWLALWADVKAVVRPEVWDRLEPLQ